MVKSGADLVCKSGYKLYNVDVPVLLQKNATVPYSCCLDENQSVPPAGTPGTTG